MLACVCEAVFPPLRVEVRPGRSSLTVVARAASGRDLRLEATYEAGSEGIRLSIFDGASRWAFAGESLAAHPALSAILRLIADEVDLRSVANEDPLPLLFGSLLVYARRLRRSAAGKPRRGSAPHPPPSGGVRAPTRPGPAPLRFARDSRVERALQLLNEDISRRWTVDTIARCVGLSRPAFARRFLRAIGQAPMRYLTGRRMQLAAALLLGSDQSLAEVAVEVGYRSEFAFSRAFKRHHRVAPATFRHGGGRTQCLAGPRSWARAA